MKKLTLTAAMLLSGLTMSYADTKIAIVNPAQIFSDSNQGSLSVKKLENELKPEVQKLQVEQDAIMKEMQDLQKNSTTMTKAALTTQQQKIQQEQQAFTEKAQVLQKKEQDKKEELSNKFQASFDKAVNEVAKQKGYNMVITTQSLAYVSGVDDVSSQVVTLMNK